jgi:hypothetical protein
MESITLSKDAGLGNGRGEDYLNADHPEEEDIIDE